jgi:hypothetical protein
VKQLWADDRFSKLLPISHQFNYGAAVTADSRRITPATHSFCCCAKLTALDLHVVSSTG